MTLFTESDIVYKYTRADAINDGVLIDITKQAQEAGFKFPVAVTSAVWNKDIAPDDKADIDGRLWDMFWMLRNKIKVTGGSMAVLNFQVIFNKKVETLKSIVAGGDNGEPVITIMLPSED